MRLTMLILACALIVTGCATKTADVEALRDREWRMAWLEGFESMPSGVSTPVIRFGSDGHMGGNTGCNSAGAAYTVEGDRLDIKAMMVTKRACLNPRGNELEHAYVGALERARRFRIKDGELQLLDESDRVVARFR